MTLPEIWNVYSADDYIGSLRLAAQGIVDASGIDLLHIAGLSLMNLRRYEEGLTLLKAATVFRPESPHIYTNAAFLAEQSGFKNEAAAFAETGLQSFPDNTDLLLLKANSLVMQMRFDDAEVIYRQLLAVDPSYVQAMINLGNIARAHEDFEQAANWFDQAEALEPDFRDLIFARATMHTQRGEDAEAMALLHTIADDVDAQFLLSLLYLAQGDYARGFRLFRARCNSIWFKSGNFVYPLKPFDHISEAAGKHVAVIQEGGYGDLLQFVRYIPMLAEVANLVTFFAAPSLLRLFDYLPNNVMLRSSYEGYNPSEYDYVTTDVEMPYHFRTTIDTIPSTIPYLSVPQPMIEQHRLPPTSARRVGLCWAGGEQDQMNQRNYDYRRSFDLDTYAPLGRISGIEFISLQVGQRAEQTCAELPLTRVLDPSFDFLDTAAIIAQLDLVISVDTAVAHLAAAMGKQVWLLSRYDCCWRWRHNQSESVWYPGVVTVFGQQKYRDWSHPIACVTEALGQWVQK